MLRCRPEVQVRCRNFLPKHSSNYWKAVEYRSEEADLLEKITAQGRIVFGVAMLVFGIENFVFGYRRMFVDGVPWFPHMPILAYVVGAALLAAGVCIIVHVKAWPVAIGLSMWFLLCFIYYAVVHAAGILTDIGLRTVVFETLTMASSALMLAGNLRDDRGGDPGILRALIASGPYLFAISMVIFGVDHFLILGFIASLITPWIPGKMFWAVFTGAGFIAAGISIAVRWMDRWAGFFLGVMFMLWFFLLHLPRVLSAARMNNPNEWSSACIALAIWGGAWICAARGDEILPPTLAQRAR